MFRETFMGIFCKHMLRKQAENNHRLKTGSERKRGSITPSAQTPLAQTPTHVQDISSVPSTANHSPPSNAKTISNGDRITIHDGEQTFV